MNVRPLGDRLFIQQLAAKDKEGSIIIPESAQKPPTRGKVVAVGPGKTLEDGSVRPLELQVGDEVLFGDYSGDDIELEGETYRIISEEDVLGVVEEGE